MADAVNVVNFHCDSNLHKRFMTVKEGRGLKKRAALEEAITLWNVLGRDPETMQRLKQKVQEQAQTRREVSG